MRAAAAYLTEYRIFFSFFLWILGDEFTLFFSLIELRWAKRVLLRFPPQNSQSGGGSDSWWWTKMVRSYLCLVDHLMSITITVDCTRYANNFNRNRNRNWNYCGSGLPEPPKNRTLPQILYASAKIIVPHHHTCGWDIPKQSHWFIL